MTTNPRKHPGGIAIVRLTLARDAVVEVAKSSLPGKDGERLAAAAGELLGPLNTLLLAAMKYAGAET